MMDHTSKWNIYHELFSCDAVYHAERAWTELQARDSVEIRPLECRVRDADNPYVCYTTGTEIRRGEDGTLEKTERRSENFHRYEGMLLAFAEMVRGEKENPYTYDYERTLYQTILKACGTGEG